MPRLGRRVLCSRFLVVALLLCWAVTAKAIHVADGDTIDAYLRTHLGTVPTQRYQLTPERIRVLGVDTPEPKGTTLAAAKAAKAFTQAWVDRGEFKVFYCDREWGRGNRILGTVTRGAENLADELIRARHGVPYKGR